LYLFPRVHWKKIHTPWRKVNAYWKKVNNPWKKSRFSTKVFWAYFEEILVSKLIDINKKVFAKNKYFG